MTPVILCKPHPETKSGFPQPYTRSTMASGADNNQFNSYKLSWGATVGIALFSVLYFAEIFFKASRKCFWFDELFTVYLCRLPDFKSVWTAVAHGADFNPPLFYLLERGSQALFGQGLIATRLPSTIGVWLFCICLFLFVARRAGATCGFIAGAFPFFTLIQYYAYEARAHGIVLGWYGLALVCWQRSREGQKECFWLAGFGLSVLGALLTHVYAVYLLVPFALVELYNLISRTQPSWSILAVMALAFTSVTVAVYLPLVRNYRAAAIPADFYNASHYVLEHFFWNVVGPASGVLMFWLLLAAVDGRQPGPNANTAIVIHRGEIVLAVGFACIPVIGLLGCKVSHGPFFDRYFLASVAGYSIFLAIASSRLRVPWLAAAFAGSLSCLMLADLATTIYLAKSHRIVLLEPSTNFRLSTDPSQPMLQYETLSTNKRDLDVMVLPSLDYIYLFEYAPQSIKSHLYFGAPTGDINLGGYERLGKWGRINFQLTAFGPFLAAHQKFLLYEGQKSRNPEAMQAIAGAGYRLMSVETDVMGVLSEYAK
jgi:Dolichyl-phosphate-mannose-protein mannosyltransferase